MSLTCDERRILALNAQLPYDDDCRPSVTIAWVGPGTPFVIDGRDFDLTVTNSGPVTVDGLKVSGSPELFGNALGSPQYRASQNADSPNRCLTEPLAVGDSCQITITRGAFGFPIPTGSFTMTVTPWFGDAAKQTVTTAEP